MFHIHKWSQWALTGLTVQTRSCGRCGLTQDRQAKHVHDWGTWRQVAGTIPVGGRYVRPCSVNVRKCNTCGYQEVD